MTQLVQRVETLLQDMIRSFQAQDFPALVSHYDFPLALHLEDKLMVMDRPDDLIRWFADTARARRDAGLERIEARLVALDLPRQGRFRAWVVYSHYDAAGQVLRLSERTFYCRDRGGRIRVEMLHVTRLALGTPRPRHPADRKII